MNFRYPSEWIARTADGLAALAEKPWALFLLLFCVNTLAQPYAGITHDARLYSVQVLNHVEGGTYSDDLFFRYGSQDQYSLFSRVAGPLVSAFGLPSAFFVIYLVSKSLLIFGMMRLVQTLIPNRTASTLALIYCMAITVTYGGHHVLNVQENFVTPRMLACALVLIGLDLLLRGRPIGSLLTILLAAAIHPLMAFGGLLIWAGFHLWKYAGVIAFIGATVLAVALATVVLAIEPLGTRFFGTMDDVWRQAILHASSFNFPSQWTDGDWAYLAFQLAILGVAIWKYRHLPSPLMGEGTGARARAIDHQKARFLIVLLIVTFAGTVGAVLAEKLPYALFLQGQPYRALWMLAFLHSALVFWLCIEWSRHASMLVRLAGCALLAYLCCANALVEEYIVPMLVFPVVALAFRGLEKEPRDADWLVRSIQMSLVLGALGWALYKVALLVRGYHDVLVRHPEHRDLVEVLLLNLGPIVFLVAVCWLLARFANRVGRPGYAMVAVIGLGVQIAFFALPETDFYRAHGTRYRADLRKVHELIHRDRPMDGPLPTVYSNLGCLDYVWLDLRAQSYFDWWQAGNYMFRRDMAFEGRRRARLVAPFELARYWRYDYQINDGYRDSVSRLFQTDYRRGPLQPDDFAPVCEEPGLDYLVLSEQIDGVPSVKVGCIYVYSCQDVRAALSSSAFSVRLAATSRDN